MKSSDHPSGICMIRRTSCEVRELKFMVNFNWQKENGRTSCEVRELKSDPESLEDYWNSRTSCEVRELK